MSSKWLCEGMAPIEGRTSFLSRIYKLHAFLPVMLNTRPDSITPLTRTRHICFVLINSTRNLSSVKYSRQAFVREQRMSRLGRLRATRHRMIHQEVRLKMCLFYQIYISASVSKTTLMKGMQIVSIIKCAIF